MLVKIDNMLSIFIPDAKVTTDVMQALLASTMCKGTYDYTNGVYKWHSVEKELEIEFCRELPAQQEKVDGA